MKNYVYLVLLLFLANSCASIVSGTTQEMTFDSEPQGVEVNVNGKVVGKTPFTVQLDKKKDQKAEFKLEGYKTQTRQLTTEMDNWFWGNIVLGGVIGSTTDGISGSIHQYSPNQYFVTMAANNSSSLMPNRSKKARAKEFIVMSHSKIMTDIAIGEGEYLDALFSLLKIQNSNRLESKKEIKSLSEIHTNIPEFAEQVASRFIK